jgi:hypothetical protein
MIGAIIFFIAIPVIFEKPIDKIVKLLRIKS